MWLVIVILALALIVSPLFYLLSLLLAGKFPDRTLFFSIIEVWVFIIDPFIYGQFGSQNDCCSLASPFALKHQLSIVVLILLCLVSYFYSSYRTQIAPPLLELLINIFLILCIVLNVVIVIHLDPMMALFGNFPIIALTLIVLIKNHDLLLQSNDRSTPGKSKLTLLAHKILYSSFILKYPILLILAVPVLVLLAALLLVFNQKPDSFIRAFTDTYHFGLSQWDYKCLNVECGGHFLCSVAANGHREIVKPQRLGIRHGNPIKCNRQLLIANAFEELMEQYLPMLHRKVRTHYNKVGKLIHRYYRLFNNKFVSDIIYILMKPLEWIFLITLYTFDRKPENRIARQYMIL